MIRATSPTSSVRTAILVSSLKYLTPMVLIHSSAISCISARVISAFRCCIFEAFHHKDHKQGGDDAQNNQHAPNHDEGESCVPDRANDRGEVVTYSASSEPEAHHDAFKFRRCHLRDEGDTHWAKEEFTECKYQICSYQPVRRHEYVAYTACLT